MQLFRGLGHGSMGLSGGFTVAVAVLDMRPYGLYCTFKGSLVLYISSFNHGV